MQSQRVHDHTYTLCAAAHCHQQHICVIHCDGVISEAGCVQVVPKKSVSGLSLCCRWLRPIPASSTLSSVPVGPTPHVSALATEGTRYSHIPRQPMIPLYCLLLLTRGQSPVGLCGEKPVAAEDWPEPCCLLLCACQGSAKLVQSVWQLQPKLAAAAMQNIGKAACDSIVNDPTHQRMVVYLSSYAIVIVILRCCAVGGNISLRSGLCL